MKRYVSIPLVALLASCTLQDTIAAPRPNEAREATSPNPANLYDCFSRLARIAKNCGIENHVTIADVRGCLNEYNFSPTGMTSTVRYFDGNVDYHPVLSAQPAIIEHCTGPSASDNQVGQGDLMYITHRRGAEEASTSSCSFALNGTTIWSTCLSFSFSAPDSLGVCTLVQAQLERYCL